jgi:sugar phosphate isomerase/epimerase
MLSITTDYVASTGCPEPYLRRIAEAGFSHIHWCHQWCTDFLYSDCEVAQIAAWMRTYNLVLTDLHASAGREKHWGSAVEYERLAGVELVRNRIAMTERLGGDVIIMHLPDHLRDPKQAQDAWDRFGKSLDALEPHAKVHGVRIAIENVPSANDNFAQIEKTLSMYGPDYLGLCYDSGHGNMVSDGMQRLDALKDRLIAVHLHDNDGKADQHKPLFSGTIDWAKLATIIAASAYDKAVSMELSIKNSGIKDEHVFLDEAFTQGTRLTQMIEA